MQPSPRRENERSFGTTPVRTSILEYLLYSSVACLHFTMACLRTKEVADDSAAFHMSAFGLTIILSQESYESAGQHMLVVVCLTVKQSGRIGDASRRAARILLRDGIIVV